MRTRTVSYIKREEMAGRSTALIDAVGVVDNPKIGAVFFTIIQYSGFVSGVTTGYELSRPGLCRRSPQDKRGSIFKLRGQSSTPDEEHLNVSCHRCILLFPVFFLPQLWAVQFISPPLDPFEYARKAI